MTVSKRNRLPKANNGGKAADRKPRHWFTPSLKLQRQAYCLEMLRLHGVRSLLEIGCGEGDLLASLCEPASHIDEFPSATDEDSDLSPTQLKTKRSIPLIPLTERELHIDKIAGIDIDAERIERAAAATKPPPYLPALEARSAFGRRERWEPLRVELWQGSFAFYEANLDGYEAVVASEVIEHLHDEILALFGPIVLGRYRPRIIIITTPNYDFAPLFSGSSDVGESGNKNSIPDPTGRTNRIFRDADHKFEFTAQEFRDWANDLCSRYDYTVSFGGVGRAASYLRGDYHSSLHGHNPDMPATQCCVFKRTYANEQERAPRSPRATPLAFLSGGPPALAPVLRSTHVYRIETDDRSKYTTKRPPVPTTPLSEIRRLVIDCFYDKQYEARLRDLWGQSYALRRAATGRIGVVFDALLDAPDDFDIDVRPGNGFDDPDFFAEEAVWVIRSALRPAPEPAFKERSWAEEVEEEFYEPKWEAGDPSAGSWKEIKSGPAATSTDDDDEEDSDAPRGARGGKSGVTIKRDPSDDDDSSGGELGW